MRPAGYCWGERLRLLVPLGTLPFGHQLTGVRADPDGVHLTATGTDILVEPDHQCTHERPCLSRAAMTSEAARKVCMASVASSSRAAIARTLLPASLQEALSIRSGRHKHHAPVGFWRSRCQSGGLQRADHLGDRRR